MENQNKYLLLARRAREDKNTEDAKKYYDMVRTEDPENVEAKFYYSYYKLLDSTNGQAAGNFVTFCNGMNSTMSMLIDSDMTVSEKNKFFVDIGDCLEYAYKLAKNANATINGGQGGTILKAYESAVDTVYSRMSKAFSDETQIVKNALILKSNFYTIAGQSMMRREEVKQRFAFGDVIETTFPNDNGMTNEAVKHWKYCIQQGQDWPGVVEDQKLIEKYAEKIKKYEPTYQVPPKKQSRACIKVGK